ncbi:MAG: phosphoribosylanthranilate isomerase [Planctomycetaceae bacterium]|jgi:phosphoribosylanthranilate isomerase|nr:phosphoribosylanthranilate isomerase [Planctomycetaceae bacterium]
MYVKICGITSVEIAVESFAAGADMIGMVYYPPSPRHIEMRQAGRILDAVENFRECGKKIVLVVVDELPEEVDARFDYVQVHGKIQADVISGIKCGIIKVVKEYRELENLMAGNEKIPVEQLFILEMSSGILPGGNGTKWNWSAAKPFCKRFKTLIAGGITPDNVVELIKAVEPFGVDVSSGVESAAGIKNLNKIKKLMENIKKYIPQ